MTATPARLGSGWAFPVLPRPVTGDLPYASGAEKVREAILLVLRTEPGERVMRPAFGCGLRRFLAEPNTVGTRARLVRQVTATAVDDPALVLLTIRYEHARDGSQGVLVYPFYLEG